MVWNTSYSANNGSTIITPQPGKLLDYEAVEPLYNILLAAYERGAPNVPELYLHNLTYVRADALLALITAARFWHKKTGYPIRYVGMPYKIHRYLERMDTFRVGAPWILEEAKLETSQCFDRSPESNRLLEVME